MGSGVAKTLRQYEDGLFQHYYLMYDKVTKAGFSLLGLNDYYWWTNHGESQCVVSMFAQDEYGYDEKKILNSMMAELADDPAFGKIRG